MIHIPKIHFLTLSFLVFLVPTGVYAQNHQASDYLVLRTGDTLYGKVEHIKEGGFGGRRFYKKIRITDARGKTKKYQRRDVSSFSVDGVVFESFWLSQESQSLITGALGNPKYTMDPNQGEQHFLRVISKGRLSHYQLEWFEQGNSTLWSMSLLKKEKNAFLIRADQGLFGLKRKVLQRYFSNCPELGKAIQQKQIRKVRQVVEWYNDSCMQ